MNKPFSEVADNTVFTWNGKQYTKMATVKVSCCKSINAVAVDNNKERIFVQPQQDVEVAE
jgi:hypothetical protein